MGTAQCQLSACCGANNTPTDIQNDINTEARRKNESYPNKNNKSQKRQKYKPAKQLKSENNIQYHVSMNLSNTENQNENKNASNIVSAGNTEKHLEYNVNQTISNNITYNTENKQSNNNNNIIEQSEQEYEEKKFQISQNIPFKYAYNPQHAMNLEAIANIINQEEHYKPNALCSISIRKKIDYVKKEVHVYWSYPYESFIDEITYRIIYDDIYDDIGSSLPYSIPFSSLPISFKVITICKMKQSNDYNENEAEIQYKIQLLIDGYMRQIEWIKELSQLIFHFYPLYMDIRISDKSETIIIQSIQSKIYEENISEYQWNKSHICTAIRLKPSNYKEEYNWVCEYNDNMLQLTTANDHDNTYTGVFDHVFNIDATQNNIFEKIGKPLMNTALEGYNVSLIAFGETGSGKTYSMIGSDTTGTDTFNGLIPRSFAYIFDALSAECNTGIIQNFYVSLSMFQIYKHKIVDLLEKQKLKTNVGFHDSVYLQNLREIEVNSEKVAVNTLIQNVHSSRSHVFVILNLKKTIKNRYKYCSISRILFGVLAGDTKLTKYVETICRKRGGKLDCKYDYEYPLLLVLKDSLIGHSKTVFLNCADTQFKLQHSTIRTLQFAQNVFNGVINESAVRFVEKIKQQNPFYYMQLKSVNDKNFNILVSMNRISDVTQTLFIKDTQTGNDDIYSILIEKGQNVASIHINRKEFEQYDEVYNFVLYDNKSTVPLSNSISMHYEISKNINVFPPNNEYYKPNTIAALSVSKIINKETNEMNIYWATPPQSFGEISYKISKHNGDENDKKEQCISLLPYTITLSSLPTSFRITTICKINHLVYESDKSDTVSIGFMLITTDRNTDKMHFSP